jgi:signal transduction histidine kinase
VLSIDVIDDGVGFDAGSSREGTGIRGMVDRLDAIGGRLEVRSSPGAGTVVTASVPVAPGGPMTRPDQDAQEPVAASHADSSRSGPNADFGM